MVSTAIAQPTGQDAVLSGRTVFLVLAVGVVGIAVQTLGPAASALDAIAAVAMLVFGLPHGALDIALLRRAGLRGAGAVALAVAGYLVAAATMLTLWRVAPSLALVTFLLIGVVHFAEDWGSALPRFITLGTSLALIAAPALFHGQSLIGVFALLGGQEFASPLAQALVLVAPVALATGAVGVAMLYAGGRSDDAVATAACLAAMILLPPVVGFALFFCARHSPMNYARARAELGVARRDEARRDTLWLSLAAFGFAVTITSLGPRDVVASSWIHATFVTLSILTVPHMLAGMIGYRLAALNACDSVSSE